MSEPSGSAHGVGAAHRLVFGRELADPRHHRLVRPGASAPGCAVVTKARRMGMDLRLPLGYFLCAPLPCGGSFDARALRILSPG